jgi:hypothetical protein
MQVVRDEDRNKGKRKAETEDRGELGEPERGEVAPPVNSSWV